MYVGSECLRGRIFAEKQTYGFVPQSLGPDSRKLATLREQLGLLGLSLGGGDNPTPKDYAALAEQFKTAGRGVVASDDVAFYAAGGL